MVNSNFNPTTFAKDNFVCTKICYFLRNNRHIGIGLIRDVVDTIQSNYKRLKDFQHPLLIFHGKRNQTIPYKDIYKAVKCVGGNDKTLKIIENGYIELYCDTEKDALGVIMIDWILKHLKKAPVLGNISHVKLKLAPRKKSIISAKNIALLILYIIIVK